MRPLPAPLARGLASGWSRSIPRSGRGDEAPRLLTPLGLAELHVPPPASRRCAMQTPSPVDFTILFVAPERTPNRWLWFTIFARTPRLPSISLSLSVSLSLSLSCDAPQTYATSAGGDHGSGALAATTVKKDSGCAGAHISIRTLPRSNRFAHSAGRFLMSFGQSRHRAWVVGLRSVGCSASWSPLRSSWEPLSVEFGHLDLVRCSN